MSVTLHRNKGIRFKKQRLANPARSWRDGTMPPPVTTAVTEVLEGLHQEDDALALMRAELAALRKLAQVGV